MSIAYYSLVGIPDSPLPVTPPAPRVSARPMHRLAVVRRLQGVSRRAIARRLNVDIATVKKQEAETTDLPLSTLYLWQEMLEVPITELLVESEESLSQPIQQRAQMVRLMKTVLAILERATQLSVRRMAQTLVEQLMELMPELEGVSAWHAVGQRRRLDEYGAAAERRLTRDCLMYRD